MKERQAAIRRLHGKGKILELKKRKHLSTVSKDLALEEAVDLTQNRLRDDDDDDDGIFLIVLQSIRRYFTSSIKEHFTISHNTR